MKSARMKDSTGHTERACARLKKEAVPSLPVNPPARVKGLLHSLAPGFQEHSLQPLELHAALLTSPPCCRTHEISPLLALLLEHTLAHPRLVSGAREWPYAGSAGD